MDEEVLHKIEQITGYRFSDADLAQKAFTHASSVDNRCQSNERLEFLGDSILSLVICETLFERFPDYLEGDLTKIKSMIVSRRQCARMVKQIGMHKLIKTGKGMSSSRALTGSVAAGLLEAVIAAIHLDGGLDAAKKFIIRMFGKLIEQTNAEQSHGNYKSVLQQHCQQVFNMTPVYGLLDEKGPDHNKCFESEAVIGERHFSSAWGPNKKEAEQKAAYKALIELDVINEELVEDD